MEPIPYDLFQITAPINRQNRAPGDPCHTLAKDNTAHAAVVLHTPPQGCLMPDITSAPANGKTIGSLFAGIGGFDLGFERAGFKTTWACEIDQQAQAVLRLRFPEAKLHDDVCQIGVDNLEPVDIVTFGSPCQDLSVAGKRAGLAGERSGLFHEAVRVIRELRERHGKPDFAVWENVPGAFSSNAGRDFAAVIDALADIGARDIAWRVLDSRFFGVAQRRRRVFLVADFGGERADQVLALTEGVRGYSPKSRQARKGSAASTENRSGAGGWSLAGGGNAYALTCHSVKGGDPTTDNYAYRLGEPTYAPEKSACLETTSHDYSRADGFTAVAHQTELAGTLGGGSGQRGWQNDLDTNGAYIPLSTSVVRRLTPVECCRLQGFPDDWNSEGINSKGKRIPMADGPRYRQLGNAVTVNVANWLANNLVRVYNQNQE